MRVRDAQNETYFWCTGEQVYRITPPRRGCDIGLRIHEMKQLADYIARCKNNLEHGKGRERSPSSSLSACARQFFSPTDISGLRRDPRSELHRGPFSLIAPGSPDFESTNGFYVAVQLRR